MYVGIGIIMGIVCVIFATVMTFTTFPSFARFTGFDKHAGKQIEVIEKVTGKGKPGDAANSGIWISATAPADFESAGGQLTFGMPLSQVKGITKPADTGNCSVVGVAGVDAALREHQGLNPSCQKDDRGLVGRRQERFFRAAAGQAR